MAEDPLVVTAALISVVLSAVAVGLGWAAEARSRRTDRRLQMMDTPQLQATWVDASHHPPFLPGDKGTGAFVRIRVMNPGFVEDTIRPAALTIEDVGRAELIAFGRPIGNHGRDYDSDRTVKTPEDAIFEFRFELPGAVSLDSRKAALTLYFLRHSEIRVPFEFPVEETAATLEELKRQAVQEDG